MRESHLNLWSPDEAFGSRVVRVITTNGDVNKRGEAVMGRGTAAQCAYKFPYMKALLGGFLKERGNHVVCLREDDPTLFSFPVKHHWNDDADLELIKRSAGELVIGVTFGHPDAIVIPRPGCGNGNLKWEDVRPVLEPIFVGDQYVIVGT